MIKIQYNLLVFTDQTGRIVGVIGSVIGENMLLLFIAIVFVMVSLLKVTAIMMSCITQKYCI